MCLKKTLWTYTGYAESWAIKAYDQAELLRSSLKAFIWNAPIWPFTRRRKKMKKTQKKKWKKWVLLFKPSSLTSYDTKNTLFWHVIYTEIDVFLKRSKTQFCEKRSLFAPYAGLFLETAKKVTFLSKQLPVQCCRKGSPDMVFCPLEYKEKMEKAREVYDKKSLFCPIFEKSE